MVFSAWHLPTAGIRLTPTTTRSTAMGLQKGTRLREADPHVMLDNLNNWTLTLHNYFGYEEDWVRIPIDDQRGMHWMLVGDETTGVFVLSPEPFTEPIIEAGKDIYSYHIYTQRHLPRWVYRRPVLTMACVDTRCDGNKFLMILESGKECKDVAHMDVYRERWGKL